MEASERSGQARRGEQGAGRLSRKQVQGNSSLLQPAARLCRAATWHSQGACRCLTVAGQQHQRPTVLRSEATTPATAGMPSTRLRRKATALSTR